MTKGKIVAIIALFLILIGLAAGLYLLRQQQEIAEKAAPATSVTLVRPTKTIIVGDTFDVTAEADTSTNTLSSADLEINFDKEKLEISTLTPGTFLPVVLTQAKTDNTTGKATISVGAQASNPPQGKGILATLKFKAKAAGNASIAFGTNTKATGLRETADVIVSKNPATITIIALAGSTSPSPQASSSPASPSPVSSPLASPQAGKKPTVNLPTNKTVKTQETITGSAAASSSVSLSFDDQTTATVKADSAGKWSYTLPAAISSGTHTLTVTDTNGTFTTSFTVSGAKGSVAAPSGETPEAGITWPTTAAAATGLLLILTGTLFSLK